MFTPVQTDMLKSLTYTLYPVFIISHPRVRPRPSAETGNYKGPQINFCKGAPRRVPRLKLTGAFSQYNGWPNIPLEAKLIKYSVPPPHPPFPFTHLA